MKRYQMQFHTGDKVDDTGYFKYLECHPEEAYKEAIKVADEEYHKAYENRGRSFGHLNPIEKITVREYNGIIKEPTVGGYQFKLGLIGSEYEVVEDFQIVDRYNMDENDDDWGYPEDEEDDDYDDNAPEYGGKPEQIS